MTYRHTPGSPVQNKLDICIAVTTHMILTCAHHVIRVNVICVNVICVLICVRLQQSVCVSLLHDLYLHLPDVVTLTRDTQWVASEVKARQNSSSQVTYLLPRLALFCFTKHTANPCRLPSKSPRYWIYMVEVYIYIYT